MNSLTHWNTFNEMMNLHNDLDRLFEDTLGNSRLLWQVPKTAGLAVDLMETDDGFTVQAAVPGINPDDLDVTLTDNVLTIKGEVGEGSLEEAQYHLRERFYGTFSRSIRLPVPVVSDEVEANYENGILTLQIPKAEEVRPKRITVQPHNKELEAS